MKITIALSNMPLSITIEGPDDEITKDMIDFVSKTLIKLREVWLIVIQCQMKQEEKKKANI